MFRKIMSLIFAVSLLMLSVSAAEEAEAGLFGELIATDYSDERLAALDAAAEKVSVSQTAGSATVEVSQAYYEGNRVFISYTVSGPAEVLDGLELENGSYADIIAGGEAPQENGPAIGWKECVVPEDETADPQTFCLAYRTPESEEKRLLSFTVRHNVCDRYLQGVSQTASFQAQASLYTGKVDLMGTVRIISPEQAASWSAWMEGAEDTGTDVIGSWNLYQNGEPVSVDLFGAAEVNGTDEVVFSVMFPFLEDLSGLTLVPEYSEGGEKPDEAIVLELTDQEQPES